MTLTQRLKDSTQAIHRQTEELPLARAIASGTIERDHYVALLQQMAQIHSEAEWEFELNRDHLTPFRESMLRHDTILQDLQTFGVEAEEDPNPRILSWLESMRAIAQTHPEVWLGALYIFEGSRLGSAYLGRVLAKSFQLDAQTRSGLLYHLDGIETLQSRWNQFKVDCDALPLDESQQLAVLEGARLTFELIHDVYTSIAAAPEMSLAH